MASVKKGLVDIAREILEDIKKDSELIIRDAEKKAEEILRDAKAKAEKRHSRLLAVMEIRNRRLQVKEEYINAVFDKSLARLKQFTESDSYHSNLLTFIEEATKKIESDRLIVYVNSKDGEWLVKGKLDELSGKLGVKLTLANETENCLGGCIVKTPDGKLSHDNTFENRLQALKPILRIEIAKILFEKED